MIKRLLMAAALSGAVAFGLAGPASSADKDAGKAETAVKQDNSKVNKEMRQEATADQQKENPADRKLAQKVRRAIVKDKALSTYAHNVKVIVRGGEVTLKGPVRSDQEKAAVEKVTARAAGKAKVTSELTVAPKEEKADKKEKKEK